MSSFKDVLELVRTRKWDTLLILGLLTVAMVAVPVWVTQKQKGIAEEVNQPIYDLLDKMDQRQEKTDQTIDRLCEIQEKQILESAIAGYKKINGNLEKLESSTQNAAAIKMGLLVAEVREILYSVDNEATKMYMEYFGIEV